MTRKSSARGPSRGRGPSGETRARLTQVCTDILRAEGQAAVSVQRVTAEAGIATPGFYKHFANVEELLVEALGGHLADLARRQSVADAIERLGISTGLPTLPVARIVLDEMLGVFISERHVAELFLRYRSDHTMLRGIVAELSQQVLDDTKAAVWHYAKRLGVTPKSRVRIGIYAEHLLGLYYRAAEMLVFERYKRADVVEYTTLAILSLTTQEVSAHRDVLVWNKQ